MARSPRTNARHLHRLAIAVLMVLMTEARRPPGTIRVLSAMTREMRLHCEQLCLPHRSDCIFTCMSPSCRDQVYQGEPLEAGQVDYHRESDFLACMRQELAVMRRRVALQARAFVK